MSKPVKRKYWYKIHLYECPVCGSEEIIKIRAYVDTVGPKPKNPYVYHHKYDWCSK